MTHSSRAVAARLACVAIFLVAEAASAQSEAVQELANRHAPIMMIKTQDGECDTDGEQYAPSTVDVVLGNQQVLLRQVGTDNPVMKAGPRARDLFGLGEGFYLDFPGDALVPGCIYEKDFRRYSGGRRPAVYAHVAVQDDAPGQLALQYWFYWYYNDWNNKHESDWEGIQLLFDVGSAEEALSRDPVSVGYAQHEGGERADWQSPKLTRQGPRPVVYSSRGSHASYFDSALYLGRRGTEGFGCDNTDGPSTALDPEVIVLPHSVDDADHPLAWLAFEGRWGERQGGAFNGPTGPITKKRWAAPIDWHDDLRSSSVIVPAGDTAGDEIVDAFCGVVGFGSKLLITLEQQPVFLITVGVLLFLLVRSLVGRTNWSAVEPLPIVERRRAGQLMRAAAELYRAHPWPFAEVGVLYIPISLLIGLMLSLFSWMPLFGPLLESEENIGLVGLLLTLLLASLGHTIGFVGVRAVVAVLMDGLGRGDAVSGRGAYWRTYERLGDLVGALVRATLIVVALSISIVGIPWAIRQLVRYQFLAEATVLESLSPRAALDRSSDLVRGRWLHTAVVLVALNALVLLFEILLGLVLLVVVSGLPLWLFSILVSAVAALLAPYTAIATTLLYGDARAERDAASA